jgi:hypothetical protein
VSNDSFENKHPLTGPRFGDFHLQKIWTNSEIRIFDMSQGRGPVLHLEVRQFSPPTEPEEQRNDNKGRGGKGRDYYSIPWAVADLRTAIKQIYRFIDDSVPKYIAGAVGSSNLLLSWMFKEAHRLAFSSQPVSQKEMNE